MNRMNGLIIGLLSILLLLLGTGMISGSKSHASNKKKKTQKVKVINGPNMPASVEVENDENNPVPVVITEGESNETLVYFQSSGFLSNDRNNDFSAKVFEVPVGKRLIIKDVGFIHFATDEPDLYPPGGKAGLWLRINEGDKQLYVGSVELGGRNFSRDFGRTLFGRQTFFFVDEGSFVQCWFERTYIGPVDSMECSLTGKLVDLPD